MINIFPENFIFGAATSSYQIEGENLNSDWYEWELNSNKPIEVCGKACDSWNRYEEDISLLEEFNLDAYRMSIEWSRTFPSPNTLDKNVICRYKKILSSLKEKNIKIFLTIQHHTLPKWLNKGWLDKNIENHFSKYVSVIAKEFSPLIDAWIPINEPAVNTALGYFLRDFPPGSSNLVTAFIAVKNILKCHFNAYQILKEENANIPVGYNKQLVKFKAYKNSMINKGLSYCFDYLFNKAFINIFNDEKLPILRTRIPGFSKCVDFWGLNFYTHEWVSIKNIKYKKLSIADDSKLTQTGWEWAPSDLTDVIERIWKFKELPIYITENGIATDNDEERKKFIYQHLESVMKALEKKIDVKGYFYWSLMDNFEWNLGYGPKFGLASIERQTFKRVPKASGFYLGNIARSKTLNRP